MPTSQELLDLAERCAAKLDLDGRQWSIPSFSDAEEQAEDEYEALQQVLEVPGIGPKTFEQAAGFLRIRNGENPLDMTAVHPESYAVVEQIAAALPEQARTLIVELADNHARHVWLQQEGAYHFGLAVGRRLKRTP